MKLYKYCEEQYNPLNGCKTLRISTTCYFRKNYEGEGDYINDHYEGLTGVTIPGIRITESKLCADGLIFSTVKEKLDLLVVQRDFSPKYNSCFCINDNLGFHQELTVLVQKQLTPENVSLGNAYSTINTENLPQASNVHGLISLGFQGPIAYEKDDMKFDGPLSSDNALILTHCYKAKKFQYQHEYRFLQLAASIEKKLIYDLEDFDYIMVNNSSLLKYYEAC